MNEVEIAEKKLNDVGYLDLPVGSMDLAAEITRLKNEKNAILLAHYYQEPEIQELADYLGDSLYLSKVAAEVDADMIVFAGVHFMAETAKILNPHKKVILPDLKAGCSLADSCLPEDFAAFKKKHPDHYIISYINCTAEIKAMSDVICTSSNALKIIESVPADRPIIFAPDRNLGRYLMKQTGRDMLIWDGACIVHEAFSADKIIELHKIYPKARIIAHPESEAHILKMANFIGSTTALLDFVKNDTAEEYIVATEVGILHEMRKKSTNKKLIAAPINEDNTCACSECAFMKMNTLEKLYLCIKHELPEIKLSVELIEQARLPIERMLAIS